MSRHASDSSEQQAAEQLLLAGLNEHFGLSLMPTKVTLEQGVTVNLDGMDRDRRAFCEIYSRIGELKPAQKHKVAGDILKMALLERTLGGTWNKYLCFADDTASKSVLGRKWLATATRQMNIEIVVLPLPDATRSAILQAQERQRMVNP